MVGLLNPEMSLFVHTRRPSRGRRQGYFRANSPATEQADRPKNTSSGFGTLPSSRLIGAADVFRTRAPIRWNVPVSQPSEGEIRSRKPNATERLQGLVARGLSALGMDERDAWRTTDDLQRFAHDWTPIDPILSPEDELDLALAVVTGRFRGVARPVVKEVAHAAGDAARQLARPARRRARAAIRSSSKAPQVQAEPTTSRAVSTQRPEVALPVRQPKAPATAKQRGKTPPVGSDIAQGKGAPSYANHSWESAPGENTDHLSGFGNLLPEEKAKYHQKTKDVFLTPDGRSRIALGYGQSPKPSVDVPGDYEGKVSPGSHDPIRVLIDENTRKLDPTSVREMNTTAATHALLGGQKGAAWHHFDEGGTLNDATAVRFDLGRPLSEQDLMRIGPRVEDGFGKNGAVTIPSQNGFLIAPVEPKAGQIKIGDFARRLQESEPVVVNAELVPGLADMKYIENDWGGTGRFGADYARSLLKDGIPNVGERFDNFAPKLAEQLSRLDPETAAKHGLKTSEDIQFLRKTIADKGWDGFMRLIDSGRFSRTLVPLFIGWMGMRAMPHQED